MEDIFNNPILCNECKLETINKTIVQDGFELRAKVCPHCKKEIYHPLDFEEFKNFNKIRNKQFQVKLRYVGNSYTVSIPKEIIDFQEEFNTLNREMNKLIKMTLEEPEKLSLFFKKSIRRL